MMMIRILIVVASLAAAPLQAALASLSVLWWAVRAGTSHDIRVALPQLERAIAP